MPFDEKLGQRVRAIVAKIPGYSEKKMFGGVCFLLNGNMCCGIAGPDLMIRVERDDYERFLVEPHARPMTFTGREMKGMLFVGPAGVKTGTALSKWVRRAQKFAEKLPAKPNGAKMKKKTTKKVIKKTVAKASASKAKPSAAKKKTVNKAKPATKKVVKKATKKVAKKITKKTSAKKASTRKSTSKRAKPGAKKADVSTDAAAFAGFSTKTFAFLKGLAKNNKKEWFDAHRGDYEAHYLQPAQAFVSAIGPGLTKVRPVSYLPKVNGSIFRINRDVRFSRDKTPYKAHVDMWFWEGEKRGWASPGFFMRLAPHQLIIGAGMHGLEKEQLARYREAVVDKKAGGELARLINELKKAGYGVGGASRKKVPRGYEAEHARAELLLHEGLFAELVVKVPAEAKTPQLVDYCLKHFKKMSKVSAWLAKHVQ